MEVANRCSTELMVGQLTENTRRSRAPAAASSSLRSAVTMLRQSMEASKVFFGQSLPSLSASRRPEVARQAAR